MRELPVASANDTGAFPAGIGATARRHPSTGGTPCHAGYDDRVSIAPNMLALAIVSLSAVWWWVIGAGLWVIVSVIVETRRSRQGKPVVSAKQMLAEAGLR